MSLRDLMFNVSFNGDASAITRMDSATDTLRTTASSATANLAAMSKSFGAVGKSLMTKVTAPLVAGIGLSINEFAKLEQSVGGVETLFKDSANSVISNSETAYKRAGVSANAYMESVTSFSASLLQGLGGDTEKAAKIADMAMVDMSDNANKFGTDIGAIQNAYQGFAKDNFTMLDNLKLGFGGTAGEMARLINESGVMGKSFKATAENVKDIGFDKMIEAINVTQTAMGVTGTTSLEAMETVAGSIGMAKSSIQDFLGGLGNSKADVGQLTKNMVESFTAVVKNIKGVLATMWDNIPLEGWQKNLIVVAAATGPLLFGLSKVMGLISQGPAVISGVSKAFEKLTSPTGLAIAAIVGIIAAMVYLYKTNEDFRDKVNGIWESIKNIISTSVQFISDVWAKHGEMIKSVASAVFGFILEYITGVVTALIDIIGGIVRVLGGLIDFLVGVFTGNWSMAWDGLKNIIGGTIDTIVGLWNGLKELFKKPLTGIVNIFKKEKDNTTKVGIDSSHYSGLARVYGSKTPKSDGIHKTGKNYIPKDNYKGILHKGEMVLTEKTSNLFRSLGGTKDNVPKSLTTNDNQTETVDNSTRENKSQSIVFSPIYNIELSGTATESDKQEIEKVIDRKTRELFNIFFKEMNMKMA